MASREPLPCDACCEKIMYVVQKLNSIGRWVTLYPIRGKKTAQGIMESMKKRSKTELKLRVIPKSESDKYQEGYQRGLQAAQKALKKENTC